MTDSTHLECTNMIYPLYPARQHYAWGGYDFIPQLLRSAPDGKPYAELWYGDHGQAPALIDVDGKRIPLDAWLKDNPQALSPTSRERFGLRLPFLLKILDVRLPLSIQLHPDKAQAEAGFARENKENIPENQRNYVDDNHKPENMVALSDFWLLHGFAEAAVIDERLRARPSLHPLRQYLADYGLKAAYAHIMQADNAQLHTWLAPLLAQPAPQDKKNPDFWLHHTVKNMGITADALDAGLLSFYLFNIVHLSEGEGIFQRARLPHAYLLGQNIEIMAASNNVLRAGLTPKHIDIPELLRIIDADPVIPAVLPEAAHYPAPVEDYRLDTVRLKKGERFTHTAAEAGILLIVRGAVRAEAHSLQSAEALFVPAGQSFTLTAEADSYLAWASSHIG